jgi:hypothetical protein
MKATDLPSWFTENAKKLAPKHDGHGTLVGVWSADRSEVTIVCNCGEKLPFTKKALLDAGLPNQYPFVS